MRLRRPLPAVQGDTLHIVGVGDNRIGKESARETQDVDQDHSQEVCARRWPVCKRHDGRGVGGDRIAAARAETARPSPNDGFARGGECNSPQYTTRSCWLWPGHLDWWFSGDEETNQLNGLTPVDRIDELSPYPLETVSEDGFCHPFVGFEADRLGLVEPIADFVRPAEGDGKDGGELGDALRVGHVGVFEGQVRILLGIFSGVASVEACSGSSSWAWYS